MSDTPETDAAIVSSEGQWSFILKETCQRLERERDEWKAKFIQANKDYGFELRDPCGTIWTHANKLQQERDEALKELNQWRDAAKGAENPHPDEVHCTCVPLLRGSLELARKERDQWREIARIAVAARDHNRDMWDKCAAELDEILKSDK